MVEQENLQVVKKAYAAFLRGDIAAVLDLCAEEVEWFLPGNARVIPVAGSRRGRQQVEQFFAALGQNQEAQQFEPREFVAQGERVVALGFYRWRIKPTGRTAESEWAHVFTIRDRHIAEFHEYYDTAALEAAYSAQRAEAV